MIIIIIIINNINDVYVLLVEYNLIYFNTVVVVNIKLKYLTLEKEWVIIHNVDLSSVQFVCISFHSKVHLGKCKLRF